MIVPSFVRKFDFFLNINLKVSKQKEIRSEIFDFLNFNRIENSHFRIQQSTAVIPHRLLQLWIPNHFQFQTIHYKAVALFNKMVKFTFYLTCSNASRTGCRQVRLLNVKKLIEKIMTLWREKRKHKAGDV